MRLRIARSRGQQTVLLVGPRLDALSGVSTHIALLLASPLAREYRLIHFAAGSEGRGESSLGRAARLVTSPVALGIAVLVHHVAIVHLNTGLTRRAFWRDFVYAIVARICGARVVYQLHGGARPHEFCRANFLPSSFVRATLRLPDVIIGLSRSECRAFQEFVRVTPVVHCPNAVECTPYASPKRAVSDAHAPLNLLYIGRLVREKGLFELLAALQRARSERVSVACVIAGGGADEGSLRAAAASAKLECVSFVGPVRGSAKVALLEAADASLLASYDEGMPYAVLESMAAGVPVIATRVGAIPEVVAHGVNGLLIEPRDSDAIATAICTVARDRAALAQMSESCRKTVETRHSVERLTRDLSDLYANVCAGRSVDPCRA